MSSQASAVFALFCAAAVAAIITVSNTHTHTHTQTKKQTQCDQIIMSERESERRTVLVRATVRRRRSALFVSAMTSKRAEKKEEMVIRKPLGTGQITMHKDKKSKKVTEKRVHWSAIATFLLLRC